jgi:hypothetical protein
VHAVGKYGALIFPQRRYARVADLARREQRIVK